VTHKEPLDQYPEPTLEEILSDPIVEALMEADGINRFELEAMLTAVSQTLHGVPLQPSAEFMDAPGDTVA
jgi:hypothetical protein